MGKEALARPSGRISASRCSTLTSNMISPPGVALTAPLTISWPTAHWKTIFRAGITAEHQLSPHLVLSEPVFLSPVCVSNRSLSTLYAEREDRRSGA